MRDRINLAMASLGLLLFLIVPLSARGAEEAIYKKLGAGTALKNATKNLAKSKNYKAKMLLEGGITEREDHELTDKAVKESFEGDVFMTPQGTLMHVQKETGTEAYRYPKKGVAFVQGSWRSIMSDAKTKKLERLFTFPDLVLARAIASGNAKWIKPPSEAKAEAKDVSDAKEAKKEAKEGEGEDSKGASSGTSNNNFFSQDEDEGDEKPKDKAADKKASKKAVGKDGAKKDTKAKTTPKKAPADKPAEEEQQPRFVRVEASPKEALEHFTDIQNSGCLGAG